MENWDHVSIPKELGDRIISGCDGDFVLWMAAIGELQELIGRERSYEIEDRKV